MDAKLVLRLHQKCDGSFPIKWTFSLEEFGFPSVVIDTFLSFRLRDK